MTKYVAILGGYPDVGKGILAASVAYLLKQRGNKVFLMKFDGYFNIDSGTMNQEDYGSCVKYHNEEVFVLNDGFCCDADSGYYERFLDQDMKSDHNLTNGIIFSTLLDKERSGAFPSGKVLELNDIKRQVYRQLKSFENEMDFVVIEVGGTIGDSENKYFIELLQEMRNGGHDMRFIILAPIIKFLDTNPASIMSSETKIIRMTAEKLKKKGIKIDVLICRSQGINDIYEKNREQLSERCYIPIESIFLDPRCDIVYELPSVLENQRFIQRLFPDQRNIITDPLRDFVKKFQTINKRINITIFGNTQSNGSFVSLNDAILHSCVKNNVIPFITWKQSLDDKIEADGVILTDGFKDGSKVVEKVKGLGVPFLAICGGFQSVIRTLTGKEPDKTVKHCGERKIVLTDEKMVAVYRNTTVNERYRLDGRTYSNIEVGELKVFGNTNDHEPQIVGNDNEFFIAVQFHPEYRSRPTNTHPLIDRFIMKAIK